MKTNLRHIFLPLIHPRRDRKKEKRHVHQKIDKKLEDVEGAEGGGRGGGCLQPKTTNEYTRPPVIETQPITQFPRQNRPQGIQQNSQQQTKRKMPKPPNCPLHVLPS